jgi:hypothetical protein
MLTAKTDGFKVMPAISDNELMGIGLVSHNWSVLEAMLDDWLLAANGGPFKAERGHRASFVERARRLRHLSLEQLRGQWAERVGGVIEKALSLKGQRDQIIHGIWGGGSGDAYVRLIDCGVGGASRKVRYGKLREIALKIDGVSAQLLQVALESCEVAGLKPITLRGSWDAMRATTS